MLKKSIKPIGVAMAVVILGCSCSSGHFAGAELTREDEGVRIEMQLPSDLRMVQNEPLSYHSDREEMGFSWLLKYRTEAAFEDRDADVFYGILQHELAGEGFEVLRKDPFNSAGWRGYKSAAVKGKDVFTTMLVLKSGHYLLFFSVTSASCAENENVIVEIMPSIKVTSPVIAAEPQSVRVCFALQKREWNLQIPAQTGFKIDAGQIQLTYPDKTRVTFNMEETGNASLADQRFIHAQEHFPSSLNFSHFTPIEHVGRWDARFFYQPGDNGLFGIAKNRNLILYFLLQSPQHADDENIIFAKNILAALNPKE